MKKTKFDLNAALAGKRVITRRNLDVIEIVYLAHLLPPIRVGGSVILGSTAYHINWDESGRYAHDKEHPLDLFMVEESEQCHKCRDIQKQNDSLKMDNVAQLELCSNMVRDLRDIMRDIMMLVDSIKQITNGGSEK